MENKIQFFDSIQLIPLNGENHIIITDKLQDKDAFVRVRSVNLSGNDFEKWTVTIAIDSGAELQYRNKFDTEKSASLYSNEIMLLLCKTGLPRVG